MDTETKTIKKRKPKAIKKRTGKKQAEKVIEEQPPAVKKEPIVTQQAVVIPEHIQNKIDTEIDSKKANLIKDHYSIKQLIKAGKKATTDSEKIDYIFKILECVANKIGREK